MLGWSQLWGQIGRQNTDCVLHLCALVVKLEGVFLQHDLSREIIHVVLGHVFTEGACIDVGLLAQRAHVRSLACVCADVTFKRAGICPGNTTGETLEWFHSYEKIKKLHQSKKKPQSQAGFTFSCHVRSLTLVVVDVTSVLAELSELPPTLFALPHQVLLDPALLPVSGFLYVPPKQSLFVKLLSAHITPARTYVIIMQIPDQRLLAQSSRGQD